MINDFGKLLTENNNLNVEKRLERLVSFIEDNEDKKETIVKELKLIASNLNNNGEWTGDENTKLHKIWENSYQGYTRENIEQLINGINKNFPNMEKILNHVKEFLVNYKENPEVIKRRLAQAIWRIKI